MNSSEGLAQLEASRLVFNPLWSLCGDTVVQRAGEFWFQPLD
jgi:hypothetical protein